MELRGWELYGRALWNEGAKVQHLSFIRLGENQTESFLVKIEQATPGSIAIMTAVRTRRHTINDEPVSVHEAMTQQEWLEFMSMFHAMPGTPPHVRIDCGE